MLLIEPRVFEDSRGTFFESFSGRKLADAGIQRAFVQERTILWNDRDLAIDWPLRGKPILSEKDSKGLNFKDAPIY